MIVTYPANVGVKRTLTGKIFYEIDIDEKLSDANAQYLASNEWSDNKHLPQIDTVIHHWNAHNIMKQVPKNSLMKMYKAKKRAVAQLENEAYREAKWIVRLESPISGAVYWLDVTASHDLVAPELDWGLFEMYEKVPFVADDFTIKTLSYLTHKKADGGEVAFKSVEEIIAYAKSLYDDLIKAPIVEIGNPYSTLKYAEELALIKADADGKIEPMHNGIRSDLNNLLKRLYEASTSIPDEML